MNFFSKAYCRVYQTIFKWVMPLMPYREPQILDSVLDIAPVLLDKNINNVLLVTDNGILDLGLAKSLEKSLKENKIKFTVFSDIVPNPTTTNVENGVEVYNANACQALIAFGGGSVMDCAKGIGARVSNPDKPINKMKGLLKVKNPIPLLFAIPTTAGTGSETTVTAVITDADSHHKYTINDFKLIPTYAVLDESLTLKLPKGLTATTGMDALTHAIEAFIGNSTTDYASKCALDAARLIFENITKVYDDGSNERSRKHMLKASYLAGCAFTRSYVGYVHAVAHTLGGQYGTPHGLANAVILPYMLAEYGSTINKKLARMAVYCDIAKKYDSEEMAASKFINKILELNDYMGIPKTFDFIKDEDISDMAKKASAEANPLYPVPKLMDAKELEKIYYKIKS